MPSEISNELHTAVQKDDMEAVDEILANNPGALAETTQVTYMCQSASGSGMATMQLCLAAAGGRSYAAPVLAMLPIVASIVVG